ncbi:MAG: MmcQ/YjbR family DNA-binding protein [Acidobacteriaceae bacterium]
MTASEFRRLALSLPETEEREHMHHPDFRVAGKIFATLAYPDKSYGMVKLFADQQAEFVATDPKAFTPVNGAWGKKGCTHVHLKVASGERVREALATAWQNTAPRGLAKQDAARETAPACKPRPARKRRA